MPDKRCPNCNRWNSGSALVCDCGFNFSTNTMPEAPAGDNHSTPSFWRVGLTILGAALLPGFVFVAYLALGLRHLAPLLAAILYAILVLFPAYWLLYFTRLEKTWARYLMLILGLVCLLVTGLVLASLILRIINPQ